MSSMNNEILEIYEDYYKNMSGINGGKEIAAAILTKLEYKVTKGI